MAKKRQLMPRDVVVDRMMATINGTSAPDPERFGFMSRQRAVNTIDLFKSAYSNPLKEEDMDEHLAKSVTIATGLTYYDLRAPALNLFPTVTPLRNSAPRMQREHPGDAAHWKSVTSTIGSGFPYMGWVPEGQRSASMSYVTANNTLSYMTLGEEDSLTEEARFAAEGFEDEDSLVQLRLLLKMFVKEEAAILGGNNSLQLGTMGTVAVSQASVTGSTLPTETYSVIAVGLTQEGFLNSSLSSGVATTLLITGNDQLQYTLNGGSSAPSVNSTQAITLGETLYASVPVKAGTVAYAWFVATHGNIGTETLQAITTINSVAFSTPLATGRQKVGTVTADNSTNPNYAYNGLLTTAFASSNAYVNQFVTGTAGTGTALTSSGNGSVNEIDTQNKTMWDLNRIATTVMYVNSQELKSITAEVLNGSSAPLLRYETTVAEEGMPEYKVTAGGVVSFYFNPFTPDGGVKMPIKVHPNLAPGTIFSWAEHLPPWYVSNATPEVAVVQTRQDYYAEVWPKTTRTQFYGVYCQSVVAVYAPFGLAILSNISPV